MQLKYTKMVSNMLFLWSIGMQQPTPREIEANFN
jgi:hypothetical protein